jgi:isoaspartyl peptidase/L-asparaginase-like protein (Ntn-hydrolase superfamily)
MPIPVLAIHGGAGAIRQSLISPETAREYTEALQASLAAGHDLLLAGAGALDAVTLAVRLLEDSPLFNAGRGAVYAANGRHELDAAIMDGSTRAAGALACVHGVKNPILGARAIMESRHVFMAGEGAMDFLRARGIAFEPEEYFHTDFRLNQLREAQKADAFALVLDHDGAAGAASAVGTVGAVALDAAGRLAAATSTGGMTNKLPGRVGDTPIIGAGCYADEAVAVSCTGTGEHFIRLAVGADLSARVRYLGQELAGAGDGALAAVGRLGGVGGFIAVDKNGAMILPFNSEGMYRAWTDRDGVRCVAIYR